MATAFRALVMLAVLVGLPTAWIYYGPLPPEAQRIVDRFVSVAKEAVGWEQPIAPRGNERPAIAYLPPRIGDGSPPTSMATSPPYVPPAPSAGAAPVAVADAGGEGSSVKQRVEPLLAELRRIGVVQYVLERWGDGPLYRFSCEMPLGPGPELTRQFEAVAEDPRDSVEQVVAQIASWQLARNGERLTR